MHESSLFISKSRDLSGDEGRDDQRENRSQDHGSPASSFFALEGERRKKRGSRPTFDFFKEAEAEILLTAGQPLLFSSSRSRDREKKNEEKREG